MDEVLAEAVHALDMRPTFAEQCSAAKVMLLPELARAVDALERTRARESNLPETVDARDR